MPSRRVTHALTLAGAGAGGAWVFACAVGGVDLIVCPFRLVTGWPCPSCGATRAVLLLLRGEVSAAFLMNPVGPLVAVVTLLAAAGVIVDRIRGTDRVRAVGDAAMRRLRQPMVARIAVLLVLVNWAWNLQKGL